MTDATDTTNSQANDQINADAAAAADKGADSKAADTGTDTADANAGDQTADKTTALGEGDGAQDTVTVPESYDFSGLDLGEGVEFDTEAFEALEPAFKDAGLSQESANALVKGYTEKLLPVIEQRAKQQIDDAGDELRAGLARDLQADPEVGGTKLEEAKALSAKAFAHAIPKAEEREALHKFLNESGLGNHPILVRVTTAFGRLLSEASNPNPAGGEEGTADPKKVFYPTGGN